MSLHSFIISALVLLAPALASAQQYKYETVAGDPMNTRIYTLDNGLKVYLSVNKQKPRIQCNIAVRTGSRNDPHETTGLAHYLEHLMFKGTPTFGTTDYQKEKPYLDAIRDHYEHYRKLTDPAQRKQAYHEIDSLSQLAAKYNIPNEYDKMMASIGSQGSNAYTSNDVTCYVENIPSNEVENWAKVQADRFQHMVIRGFHTELEAVYEEYNIGLSNDGEKEFNAINRFLFPTHPYGTQTTIGTQEHLKNPSIVNIENYFHRYYVPNNVAICMAGDFDPDAVMAIIDKYFGGWKKSDNLSRPEYEAQPDLKAERDTTVVGKEASNILMGWKFDAASSPQADTLDVISELLSNGKAGLFDVDLQQPMKVGEVGAFNYGLNDYSAFFVEGLPKQGQSLKEVKQLILGEMDKLKRGEFSDELLPAIIANKKLAYYRSLDDNRNRASRMVDAFINHEKWERVVNTIARQEKMTKQQIVDFANRHFGNNFACVYKEEGVDTTQKKIDKPQITPIPANREYESDFVKEIKNAKVSPIQPQFLDYKKDLTDTQTSKKLPLLYKQNTENGLFTLRFNYDFGGQDAPLLPYAADYLNYIGTKDKTVSQVKQAFYNLACSYNINIEDIRNTSITLSGLSENMPKAFALLQDLLQNAKADQQSYTEYLNLLDKAQQDTKKNQRANYGALCDYGLYGAYHPSYSTVKLSQLRAMNPQELINRLKDFISMKQTVLYYGPMSEKELDKFLSKNYRTPKQLKPVPQGRKYVEQVAPSQNEIIIAPYDAKNIYMRMIHNENKPWDIKEMPLKEVFNEYFGGGMNSVVFQELRETRGLAYNAYANYNFLPEPGHPEYYFTHIISQNDKMMDCIKVFNQILDTIPQSDKAFEIAKQNITKRLQSQRITKFNVLTNYLYAKQRGVSEPLSKTVYEALPGITLKDIVNFEQQNMAHKTYRYVILGDEKNLDMEALKKIGTIKRVTTEQIFGF